MWQMVFANILVEGWIVYPNVYSFFDQPDIVCSTKQHLEDEQVHFKQAYQHANTPDGP